MYDTRYQARAAVLEDLLFGHARHGYCTPVYIKGKQVGERIVYDHGMGLRLLEVRDPRYQRGSKRTPPPRTPPARHPLPTRLLAGPVRELMQQHEAWVKPCHSPSSTAP